MKLYSFLSALLILSSVGVSQVKDSLSPEITLDRSFYKSNRNDLRKLMPDRSVALIFSSIEKVRSNDVDFPFHQDPNFYYLTGLNEEDALLILFKEPYEIEDDTVTELIFVAGRSKDYEMWHGKRLGTVGVENELGLEKVKQNIDFPDLHIRFNRFDEIYYLSQTGVFCDDPQDRGDLASMMKHFKFKTDSLTDRLDDKKLKSWMSSLREIKKEQELQLLQKAITITCEAQKELMRQLNEDFNEYNAEALVEFVFRNNGAEGPGFPSIVGGGENSCVLHYTANNANLTGDDMLVVDVGAQYKQYSADVTRTIPVNGKFSEEQKLIYNLVLKAQNAGIEKARVGNKFWDPHEAATAIIQQGLKDLGITKKAYEARKYFMHGTSHYLGLDVHDAGSYQPLQVNNVITVEPGIYIPAGSDCDEKWWDIGIRIEDDILITKEGPVNMSNCAPRNTEEIEQLMAK